MVVAAVVVAPPAAVVVAAFVVAGDFVVVGAAVEAVHAPAGIVITSPGWMTWLMPSLQPLAATSASIVMQCFLAMANSESPDATVYWPGAAVVVPGAVLAPPAALVVAPPAAVVVAPASVVEAPEPLDVTGVLIAVFGVLAAGLSSEPHAPSSPIPITTDASAAVIRRRPVEVHPFTSSIRSTLPRSPEGPARGGHTPCSGR